MTQYGSSYKMIHELRGKNLGCFCDQKPNDESGRPQMCHAQILTDLVNKLLMDKNETFSLVWVYELELVDWKVTEWSTADRWAGVSEE